MQIIYYLIIGAIAGWLAGQITKGSGFGLPILPDSSTKLT